jgi:hypothetical protein
MLLSLELFKNKYNADIESIELSDLGCAKVPSPSGTEDGWVGFWRKSINV